ncbi:MAG TPA: SBBP repeat-containing protein [Candidatus Sulfotelmatobacter sp.]|nr:SBBP repeat-containing protein [Candidatus Sulfotelmatobacter sp.]
MTLRMRLIGANTEARIQGLDELSGKTNYLIGKGPRDWHTNIPNYGRVKCTDVYPGIALVYYGNRHQLEYDFVVSPHANPSAIRFGIGVFHTSTRGFGAAHADISAGGDLVVHTGAGELRFHRPVAYQDNGSGKKRPIEASYILDENEEIELRIAAYDQARPLVIDPVLSYSTYLGPSGGIYAIAVDSSGNAYVTGGNNRTGFPTTPGAFQTTCTGGCSSYGSSFITKFNSTASALVYSTYLGGTLGITFGNSIAVDSAGDAYVTGETGASDFPTTTGALQSACSCSGSTETAFVTELDPSGSAPVYSTFLGSPSSSGAGIAVDSSGNAYVAGSTSTTNFPVTSGSYQQQNNGQTNTFIAKLNSSGSALIYSTYLGGTNADTSAGIALNSAGNAYILGNTGSNDGFPTTPGAYQSCPKCGNVLFVTELSPDATTLVYSTLLGGVTEANYPGGIAIDSSGNAYVTGVTYANDFPTTPGALQTTCPTGDCGPVNGGRGSGIAFLTKFNASGTAVSYSTYLGGSGYSVGTAVVVDAGGDAYVGGYTESLNFPLTPDAFQSACTNCTTNNGDTFLSELNASGSSLLYSTYLGGSQKIQEDAAHGIALDSNGNIYLAGQALSTNFPTTPGVFQPAASSSTIGAFVAKFAFGSPAAGVTPANLSFGSTLAGSTSASQPVTLNNTGSQALTISNIGITGTDSGDFSQTNNCGSTVADGTSCTITVIFNPSTSGVMAASLTITDDASNSPQTVSLTGTGTDFSLSAATGSDCPSGGNCSTSATVTAGQTATYDLQVSPVSGFIGTVSFGCTDALAESTCSVSPNSATLNGTAASAFTVTVATTAKSVFGPFSMRDKQGPPTDPIPVIMFLLALASLLSGSVVAARSPRRRLVPVLAVLALALMWTASCGGGGSNGGGGGNSGTPSGTVTITGTSSSVNHSVSLNLTVN